ncbi:MAG: PspC domain-containing protein [Anaerolineales bacterium]|jgi:phage shock protein C
MSEYNRLYRSRDNRMIAGVAYGLGEFLGIDPTVIRLLFVFSIFIGGTGVLAYFVMMLVVPEEPLDGEIEVVEATPKPKTTTKAKTKTKTKSAPKTTTKSTAKTTPPEE